MDARFEVEKRSSRRRPIDRRGKRRIDGSDDEVNKMVADCRASVFHRPETRRTFTNSMITLLVDLRTPQQKGRNTRRYQQRYSGWTWI